MPVINPHGDEYSGETFYLRYFFRPSAKYTVVSSYLLSDIYQGVLGAFSSTALWAAKRVRYHGTPWLSSVESEGAYLLMVGRQSQIDARTQRAHYFFPRYNGRETVDIEAQSYILDDLEDMHHLLPHWKPPF